MGSERISGRQLLSIIFNLHSAVIISILPCITTADSHQDAWLSSFVALGAVSIIALVITGLAARFPREDMVQFGTRLLGSWAGRAVSLVYLFLVLQVAALDCRYYGDMLHSGFITLTPLTFIVTVMILAASLAAIAGIEVIARIADIFFAVILLLIVSTIVIGLPNADFTLIQPVLARGWGPVLRGAVVPTSMSVHLGLVLFLGPLLVQPQKARRWVLGAVILSFISMALLSLVTVIQLGPTEASRSLYPVLRMVRSTRIGTFLDRVEAVTIFAWGLILFVGLSTYITIGARGMARIFNISDYRPLVPPMAVIWVALTINVAGDAFQLRQMLFYRYTGTNILVLLLVPLLILWLAWWISPQGRRAKKGGETDKKA